MPNVDFFNFFRYVLGTIVTIYASVLTIQWAVSWYKWIIQADRYVTLLRSYIISTALRVRVKTFWGDCVVCLLLCVIFCMLWRAHSLVNDADAVLKNARQSDKQPLHLRANQTVDG